MGGVNVQICRRSSGPRSRRARLLEGAEVLNRLGEKTGAVVPSVGPTTRRRSAMVSEFSVVVVLKSNRICMSKQDRCQDYPQRRQAQGR